MLEKTQFYLHFCRVNCIFAARLKKKSMSNQDYWPTFSIITAVHDQASDIRQNLPVMLTQQYEGSYEVIVVDESSTDETTDVLKAQEADFPHLYTTFLPHYHYQRNRRRLALTIGVKAAKHDWLIFTEADTPLPADCWLKELAEFVKAPAVILLGYINRKSGDVRLKTFDEVSQVQKAIRKTEHCRESKSGKWKLHLTSGGGYDFMIGRADLGHEVLRLFE